VVERIGAERLYRTTGVQLMQINTLFQLAAHDRDELSRARRLLMLPEQMVHALTGAMMGERTSAGTTGLVDLAAGTWSEELLDAIGVDASIMPVIQRATAYAGTWRGVPVHTVGGHDTASAVAGAPLREGSVFISSGTWMLVGVERDAPDVSDAAMRANFSNESGVRGNGSPTSVRFLKNVMGLWMLEQCGAVWGDPPVEELLDAAAALPTGGAMVDAMDTRFLAPADMEAEVRAAAGLSANAGRDVVVRCVLDSLAEAAARVMREIEEIAGVAAREIVVVGGGSRNRLLNRLIEDACGVPVRVGSAEATVLGNGIVQGMGLGRFESLDEARMLV
jgi:rhamnulokinase